MSIVLPFHQDDRLPSDSIPVPPSAVVVDPELPEGDRWTRLAALFEELATQVAGHAAPVTVLTGDCLAAAATLTGLQRAGTGPAVIWFDAHADLHTLESSASGYLGGLSLRALTGGDFEKLGAPLGLRPVPEERCLLVGARDIDPPEKAFLAQSALRQTSVQNLTADDLPSGEILLHVDLDVIDDSEVPGLRFPVPGGPTSDQVVEAIALILATGRVAALDIACPWNETQDAGERAVRSELVTQLVRSVR